MDIPDMASTENLRNSSDPDALFKVFNYLSNEYRKSKLGFKQMKLETFFSLLEESADTKIPMLWLLLQRGYNPDNLPWAECREIEKNRAIKKFKNEPLPSSLQDKKKELQININLYTSSDNESTGHDEVDSKPPKAFVKRKFCINKNNCKICPEKKLANE